MKQENIKSAQKRPAAARGWHGPQAGRRKRGRNVQ